MNNIRIDTTGIEGRGGISRVQETIYPTGLIGTETGV